MKTDPHTQTTGAGLPWVFDGDFVVVDCPRGQYPMVCRPLNDADGNLIAAAGELYELLEEVYSHLSTRLEAVGIRPDWYEGARQALAKARGESNAG